MGYADDNDETDMMTVIPAGTRCLCREAKECRIVLVFPNEDDTIIFYEWFLQAIRGR